MNRDLHIRRQTPYNLSFISPCAKIHQLSSSPPPPQSWVPSYSGCTHAKSLHMFDSETPWTVAHQAPLSMGFSRPEHWSGLPCPPPGGLPDPGVEPASLASLSLAAGFFITSTTWEALNSEHSSCLFYKNLEPHSCSQHVSFRPHCKAFTLSKLKTCFLLFIGEID